MNCDNVNMCLKSLVIFNSKNVIDESKPSASRSCSNVTFFACDDNCVYRDT